jgi:SOS-response transcriptional repressor LexA
MEAAHTTPRPQWPFPARESLSAGLTARQQEVLDFIREHHRATDSMPTQKEIAAHFGWASGNAASECLAALIRKGKLRQAPGATRGIRFAEGDSPWDEVDRLRFRLSLVEGKEC